MVGESQVPAPVFKCGWCGAITDYMSQKPPAKRMTLFRACMKTLSALKWAVVLFVTALASSIILLGATLVLPRTSPNTAMFILYHFLTWFFSFNVFFHFAACVFTTPGTVRNCYPMPVKVGEPIPQGAFENFRFCPHCKHYKPPSAHHCNMCKTCVIELDHHCPFINNCVGRANLRNFVLFLLWTMMAMSYCIMQTGFMLFVIERRNLVGYLSRAWALTPHKYDLPLFIFLVGSTTPWYLLACMYVILASFGVYLGVGLLLSSQVRYILAGPTYVTAIKFGTWQSPEEAEQRGKWAEAWTNVQRVMGSPHVWEWLLPTWGPPAGVCIPAPVSKKRQ